MEREFRSETERLVVRGVRADELGNVLAVYVSNPHYLEITEGSAGEPGRYDRQMLERDFAVAQAMPGRHLSGLFRKSDGKLVGVIDWLEDNPADGKSWVGLLMIHADRQKQGLASEAFQALAERFGAKESRAFGQA